MQAAPHSPATALTLPQVAACARHHAVPVEDALLICINLYGISSPLGRHRARVHLRLRDAPQVPWMVIVPLNAHSSPVHLVGDDLLLGPHVIGTVERIDSDEAVGGYFRDDGRAVTLNPNARSRCTGCAFCPNTLEAAADPRLAEERGLNDLIAALRAQHPRGDLHGIHEVTVSTGCFSREDAAVTHLTTLRAALDRHRIGARIGLLTSVLRTQEAFEDLARQAAPFVLRLTAECFTRRDLMLKATKADLDTAHMPAVLRRAVEAGHDASFTYIVGLDPVEAMEEGVQALVEHTTEFPNLQIYQAHNAIMAGLRAPGAQELDFYLSARARLERIFAPTGLRPQAWECYRPLWYYTFAGEALVQS